MILTLATDLNMTVAQIGQLNLTQIWIKGGRVYLKGQLIQRKAVHSLLATYRKRDRDVAFDGEPLSRDPKRPEKRLGAAGVRRIIDNYVTRAQRGFAMFNTMLNSSSPLNVLDINLYGRNAGC